MVFCVSAGGREAMCAVMCLASLLLSSFCISILCAGCPRNTARHPATYLHSVRCVHGAIELRGVYLTVAPRRSILVCHACFSLPNLVALEKIKYNSNIGLAIGHAVPLQGLPKTTPVEALKNMLQKHTQIHQHHQVHICTSFHPAAPLASANVHCKACTARGTVVTLFLFGLLSTRMLVHH